MSGDGAGGDNPRHEVIDTNTLSPRGRDTNQASISDVPDAHSGGAQTG